MTLPTETKEEVIQPASPPEPLPTAAATVPPSPEQIDAAIREYEEMVDWLGDVEKDVKRAKALVVAMVEGYGHPVPGAEQSRRLLGRRNEATVTRGNTTTVNEEQVHQFCQFMAEREDTLLLTQRFFERQVKHRLVEGARDVLKSVQLPRRVEEKILALFGKCFDVKPNAPSLKVRVIKPAKPAKKVRDGKAGA